MTLRMLSSPTSGYPDWIQGNPPFQRQVTDHPFRQWTGQDLLNAAFSQRLICGPGKCFHYAHTNFAILGRVVCKETGKSLENLFRQRVFRPLGMRHTDISAFPAIPGPALHAYTKGRGGYQDSTFWSPSWGLTKGLLMTSTVGDVIKSAKALGSGALVSRSAERQRVAPITVGLPNPGGQRFTDSLYYGLGVLVANGWLWQNPDLNGWTSIQAVLPGRPEVTIVLSVTQRPRSDPNVNYSQPLFSKLTRYLTPNHPVVLPSG